MIIRTDLNYSLKHGHPVDRFILTIENDETTSAIADKINQYKVADTSVTCDVENLTWGEFVDHRGRSSIVYEIPRKYTDAFSLYLKMINMVFYTK